MNPMRPEFRKKRDITIGRFDQWLEGLACSEPAAIDAARHFLIMVGQIGSLPLLIRTIKGCRHALEEMQGPDRLGSLTT